MNKIFSLLLSSWILASSTAFALSADFDTSNQSEAQREISVLARSLLPLRFFGSEENHFSANIHLAQARSQDDIQKVAAYYDQDTRQEVRISFSDNQFRAFVASGYQGVNLEDLHNWERYFDSPQTIRARGDNEIRMLYNSLDPVPYGRRGFLSHAEIRQLRNTMNNHPVVGAQASRQYDPNGSIRYCFGLAAYAHHLLLAVGVHPSAIRKATIVGPGNWRSGDEGFHMSTIVRAEDGHWYTIDRTFGQPMRIDQWFNHFYSRSSDQKLRLYITSPERFAPSAPRYTPTQLGIDRPRERDVYRGYFHDMLAWVRDERNLINAGVPSLPYNQVDWPTATRAFLIGR